MVLIVIALICIALCYKWGDLKNWRLYYPTILFYIIGNAFEHIVTYKRKLWEVTTFGIDTLADWFIEFIIYPFIIILFLSRYPRTITKRILFTGSFIFILSLVEYIGNKNGVIVYYDEWNIIWTIFLYFGMFILFLIHCKNEILAWIILFALMGLGMLYFDIPLSDLKR